MAKTRILRRPMLVGGDDKHPMEQLEPGDEVPSWLDDDAVDEEWLEERDTGTAGGMDLVEDHTRNEVLRAAERVGLDRKDMLSYSNEQIAALIKHKLFEEDLEERIDVDTEDYESSVDDNVALFDETNSAGNANALDQGEPEKPAEKPAKPSSRASGSDA